MKKSGLSLSLSVVIALLLCACSVDDIHIPGVQKNNGSKTASGSDTNEPIPEEAYAFWSDEQPVNPSYYEGRFYAAAKGAAAGHWEATDRKVLLSKNTEATNDGIKVTVALDDPDDDHKYEDGFFYYEGEGGSRRIGANAGMISDEYGPGQQCDPSIYFSYEAAKKSAPGKIYGSTYFANVTEGDDIFGQSVTVREYFGPKYGSSRRGHQLTRGYGRNTENRHGGSTNKDGSGETSVCPLAAFPAVVAEGDKIWLVADVVDGETWQVGIRKMVEYTWVMDPDKPAYGTDTQPEEEHEESIEWFKEEHPGQWDLTNVIYTGSTKTTSEKRGTTVKVERYGVDGQNVCFTYNDNEKYFMPYSPFDEMYYASDWFYESLGIFLEPVNETQAGNVVCIFAFSDIEIDEDGDITSFSPTKYFSKSYSDEPIKRFSPGPEGKEMSWSASDHRSKLTFEDSLPEGSCDGEKKYLVYGGFDSLTGDCSVYNVCEYTYTEGPIVEWRYNQPGY